MTKFDSTPSPLCPQVQAALYHSVLQEPMIRSLLRDLVACELLISRYERSEEVKIEETGMPVSTPEGTQAFNFQMAEAQGQFLEEIDRLSGTADSSRWINPAQLDRILTSFDVLGGMETEQSLSKPPGG